MRTAAPRGAAVARSENVGLDQRPRPKCAKARLASAMRCVFSRVVTALPSLWAASQSYFASRMWIGLPRSSRAAVMIQRKVSDC